jgi:O-methyltransferase domain
MAIAVTAEHAGIVGARKRRSPRTAVPPRMVVRAATRLRRALLRLADRLLPSELAVLEHSAQFTAGYLLAAIAELGIADQLADGPRTATELAVAAQCDADALHRALRAAAVTGIVRLDRTGRFHATRLTRALTSDAPYYSADWCAYMASPAHHAAWGDLVQTIRSGEPAFRRVNGLSLFDWFDAHPAEGTNFTNGLSGLTLSEAAAIAAAYPFPAAGRVCDVAGGSGVLLGEVLRRHRGLTGILVEAPSVLTDAATHLESVGIAERVTLLQGDLFGVISASADVYLLKWILHDWSDADCVRILRNVAAAMPAGAKLVIIEGLQDANSAHPRFSPIDLEMLVVTDGGRERPVSQFHDLIVASGLRPGAVRHASTGVSLLEAVKAPN